LKFNFGTGIKEPTFLENFSRSIFFLGNPNLKPERVRSVDFGIEQRFAADRAKLEINWFDNRFRDLIAFAGSTFINIGRAKAKGAEVMLEVKPMRSLRGMGTYTYLDSQITESQSPASPVIGVGRPLLRRPRHSGSLALLWDWRRLNVSSTTLLVGRRADSDFQFPALGLTSNPGYAKWNLAASFRSAHRVTYFAAFENLANDGYQEVLGYPALGRSVRGGLRWDW
jgi:vitamin B12 transporter